MKKQTERLSISVALCTYNGERFLQAQLDSLANQTRLPDELVVFDDCSQDGTKDILKRFAARSPFAVQLFFNKSNLGSTKNFSLAVQTCAGQWVSLCDQDDVWLPHKLERLEESVMARPDAMVVFSDAIMVDSNLAPLGYRLWEAIRFSMAEQQLFLDGHSIRVLRRKFVVTGMTMAFRTDQLQHFLPIDSNWIHDGWITYCLAARGDIIPINEPLALYRQHANQQLGEKKRSLWEAYWWAKELGTTRIKMHRDMLLGLHEHLAKSLLASETENKHRIIIAELQEKIRHINVRLWLRQSKFRRPLSICEYLNGRYRKFSLGWKSLAQDLIT